MCGNVVPVLRSTAPLHCMHMLQYRWDSAAVKGSSCCTPCWDTATVKGCRDTQEAVCTKLINLVLGVLVEAQHLQQDTTP
jgi:hypothetical protein